ncbi:MAG TPA: carboxypeptidase-like regulatory domain-containing protein, partial [Gammaproteobacteria bacterium]|nr:carboxypeptidase-like regulatory domain-containing protein [Gammaproteobacteria bacterium]
MDEVRLGARKRGSPVTHFGKLLLCDLLLCAATAVAAPGPLGLQRGMLLEDAITELESTGLTVFYSSDLVKPWSRVNVVPTAADPRDALLEILVPLGLTAQPGPGEVLLVVRDSTAVRDPAPTGGIAGIVRDLGDGRPVSGAAVSVLGRSLRAVTARDGRFAFHDLAEGDYRVAVLYPLNAFETTVEVDVEATRTTFTYVDVDTAMPTALEEIIVAASQYELTRAPGASQAVLTGEDIGYLPDFG